MVGSARPTAATLGVCNPDVHRDIPYNYVSVLNCFVDAKSFHFESRETAIPIRKRRDCYPRNEGSRGDSHWDGVSGQCPPYDCWGGDLYLDIRKWWAQPTLPLIWNDLCQLSRQLALARMLYVNNSYLFITYSDTNICDLDSGTVSRLEALGWERPLDQGLQGN